MIYRRCYHISAARARSSDPSSPWKPASEPLFDDDADIDGTHGSPEAGSSRSRTSSASLRRRLLNRQRVASRLPPVELPKGFQKNNVTYFYPGSQPRVPIPIQLDALCPRISRLHKDAKQETDSNARSSHAALEEYFETAVKLLLEREQQLMDNFESRSPESTPWNYSPQIQNYVRVWNMIIDASWHYVDTLYPARDPEYTYLRRPFWWWNIYKDLDNGTQTWRDAYTDRSVPIKMQIDRAEALRFNLPDALGDFPPEAFHSMQKELRRDLRRAAPKSFDPKGARRPIQILSMTGYGGRSIAESIGSTLGFLNEADVVHLDAYELSSLLGPYVGQDWVYSRGHVSTLGFRCAEISGRLEKDSDAHAAGPFLTAQEDDDGDEHGGIQIRLPFSSWDKEFRKRRQDGSTEIFGETNSVMINKVLDSIITDHLAERGGRPTLIHVHDYVELSMTEEGSAILSRLRSRVDSAWKKGKAMALVGTSSCEQPSDDYQSMVKQLATSDLVISREIQPDRPEKIHGISDNAHSNLRAFDIVNENAQNINRAIAAMDPDADPQSLPRWNFDDPNDVWNYAKLQPHVSTNVLNSSVLPLPEVCSLAKAFWENEEKKPGTGSLSFGDRVALGALRQSTGQFAFGDALPPNMFENRASPKPGDEGRNDAFGNTSVTRSNEYEKRISTGIIKRENLRITFADVHVAPSTVNALKLLTSLSLMRPDAFSYGVLAHDKINGCLLYGPPGTGKTMLAKAVAKESGANMIEISGASINDKWVGETEKLIRAVFTLAKKLSPCVVFIDEADALLANRSMFSSRPSHRENLNQFLKEWDGMEETNAFIMVATNRPFDLDDAVLRRLPRKLLIDLPLRDDRAAIMRLLLRGEQLAPEISLDEIADQTPFYSGSDLKNMCVAAAMVAVEDENTAANAWEGPEPYQYPERRTLQQRHFEQALKQIPASISEDMETLRLIRRFDEEYGNRRKGSGRKTMGFGGMETDTKVDAGSARVRQQTP